MSRGVGRPLKFKSVEELQRKIDDYFDSCYDEDGNCIRPLTITGLALALDTTRRTLLDYEEKDEYSHTIKMAKQRIENFAEEQLFTNRNTAGVIFNMVNNYGWTNKQDIDQSISGKDGKPLQVLFNIPRPARDDES